MAEIRFNMREFDEELDKAVKLRMQRTLHRLERIIQELFRAPKHGRLYRVPGSKKVMYRASRPGEAAAIRLGAFRKSIRSAIRKIRNAEYEGVIGSILRDPPYPLYLEKDSKDGTREARPTFALALERLRKEIAEDWKK